MQDQTVIYFDGATKSPNPGISGCGVWIPHLNVGFAKNIGIATNNEAEWQALILAIDKATEYKLNQVTITGDSQLVINCASSNWATHKEHLQALKVISDRAIENHTQLPCPENTRNLIRLDWVRREYNVKADALSKLALKQLPSAVVLYNYNPATNRFSSTDAAAPSSNSSWAGHLLPSEQTGAKTATTQPKLSLKNLQGQIDAQHAAIAQLTKQLAALEQTQSFW